MLRSVMPGSASSQSGGDARRGARRGDDDRNGRDDDANETSPPWGDEEDGDLDGGGAAGARGGGRRGGGSYGVRGEEEEDADEGGDELLDDDGPGGAGGAAGSTKGLFPRNQEIVAERVILVSESEDGSKSAEPVSLAVALHRAKLSELDLVQVSANKEGDAVCRIVDFKAFLAERNRKAKEIKARARAKGRGGGRTKTYRLNAYIEKNDLLTRARYAREDLLEGFSVKVVVEPKKDRKTASSQIVVFQEFWGLIGRDVAALHEMPRTKDEDGNPLPRLTANLTLTKEKKSQIDQKVREKALAKEKEDQKGTAVPAAAEEESDKQGHEKKTAHDHNNQQHQQQKKSKKRKPGDEVFDD
jgi:translation initiation factor IF-3